MHAAIFDMSENLAILRILDIPLSRTSQGMIDAIRRPSLIKWTLAFIALGILSSYFMRQDKWRMRAVGDRFSCMTPAENPGTRRRSGACLRPA